MKLYILEWDNGQDPIDHYSEILGAYTSENKRDEAIKNLIRTGKYKINDDGSKFLKWEMEADKDYQV